MADVKINNPRIKGKLKLPDEVAGKALQVSASGELESSAVTNAELANVAGLTSAAVSVDGTQTLTNKTLTAPVINSPTGIVKADVGLANVDNTSDANKPVSTAQAAADTAVQAYAIQRANHTGTQLAATISDFAAAAKAAAVADSITDAITDVAPSQNAVFDALALKISSSEKGANNGVATLDAGGKIPVSQLPNSVMEYQGNWNASTNSPSLADGVGSIGDVYKVEVAGSQDLGSGSISFAVGDWVVYNASGVWEKSTNSNAVVSVNGQTGIVVLTKSDVGLGNVDNTSDATKNSATATLTNKTIDADDNTILDLTVSNLKAGVLDTDLSSVSGADDTIPSAKAVKTYVDAAVASPVVGDIPHTQFAAANNQVAAADVTGLAFNAAQIRSFRALVSVQLDATTPKNEGIELHGVQLASGFVMSQTGVGDDSGLVFSITSAGQVQYTSPNSAGFVADTITFRAEVTRI